jgi:hypothetical protein
MTFLISGAVQVKWHDVLDYMIKHRWFHYVNARYFAKWGYLEVLLYMHFKGIIFDPEHPHDDLCGLGHFLDPNSPPYDDTLSTFFLKKLLEIDMERHNCLFKCEFDWKNLSCIFKWQNDFFMWYFDGDHHPYAQETLWQATNSVEEWVHNPHPTSQTEINTFFHRRLKECLKTIYQMFLGIRIN